MLDKLRVFFKVHFATAFRKTYLVETPVRIRSSIDEISSARWLIVFHLRKETPSVLCLIFQELVCQFSVCSGLALFDKKARPEYFFLSERDFCWLPRKSPHNSLTLPVAQLK